MQGVDRADAMAIRRVQRPSHPIALATPFLSLYEVQLSAPPAPAWRAAFIRPRLALATARFTPELGRPGSGRLSGSPGESWKTRVGREARPPGPYSTISVPMPSW